MTGKFEYHRALLASTKGRLRARAQILNQIRNLFTEQGFLEVETPLRIPAPAPELHIDAVPSGTHFLITSPELQMKRLLGAGYEKIFQICHCFRQGERSERHLPEFTMMEWYRSGGTVEDLMSDLEILICETAGRLDAYPTLRYGKDEIDLSPPWPRLTVADAFEQFAGWRPDEAPDDDKFNEDLVNKVEPSLPRNRPVFLCNYPASLASLAKLSPEDPRFAERFELYLGGLELANGFQELVDPVEQRRRFEKEAQKRADIGKSVYPLDELFLKELEIGLKSAAGIALGVDRLVMLLTDAPRIDDVVAFTERTL